MATRDSIRALPVPHWIVDEIFHVGTVKDTHGCVTVTFKRGSVIQKVQVRTSLPEDAVRAANLKR